MTQSFSRALGTFKVSTTTGWIGGFVHPVILVNNKTRKLSISPLFIIRISLSRGLYGAAQIVPLFPQYLDGVDIFVRGRIRDLALLLELFDDHTERGFVGSGNGQIAAQRRSLPEQPPISEHGGQQQGDQSDETDFLQVYLHTFRPTRWSIQNLRRSSIPGNACKRTNWTAQLSGCQGSRAFRRG